MHKFKCGLYLGRFQPLHTGHTSIIDRMLDECAKVIIAVGSAQESGTERNPLSFEFRKRLIEETYRDRLDDIIIIPINDRETYSDDSSWGDHLLKQVVEQAKLWPFVVYEGEESVNEHWYDDVGITVIKVPRSHMPISGTELRNVIMKNDVYYSLAYLPVPIHSYYDKIRKEIQNAAVNSKRNPVD